MSGGFGVSFWAFSRMPQWVRLSEWLGFTECKAPKFKGILLKMPAKVAGKATKEASTLASKLKKAFDEGRK